jgi:[ribosomal protein S5]-alanine N-acetyltransferase
MINLVRLSPAHLHQFIHLAQASKAFHQPWITLPQTPQAFKTWATIAGDETHCLRLITRPTDSALLGYIRLSQIVKGNFGSAYLSYGVFAEHAQQGYGKAAIKAMLRLAFNELKLHRIEANIQPANTASIALVKACGFQLEGYSPRYLKINGRWRDHERWAFVKGLSAF